MRLDLDLPQLAIAADTPHVADDAGAALIGASMAGVGAPLWLPLDDIDEDPKQPRTEFNAESLAELADSIAQRGLLQAISVRPHPQQPGRWVLNFGARRLRACRIAGLTSILATVNEMADSYDQVIENEQREGLKPLELALFVRSRMALGESQAEIARKLGKSASFVTYATALIDAPDWLMAFYRNGRCRGMRELHELRQLGKTRPECVQALQAQDGPITREMVAALKNRGSDAMQAIGADVQRKARAASPSEGMESAAASGNPVRQPTVRATVPAGTGVEAINRRFTLLARLDGGTVEVVVDAAPEEEGSIFVRDAADQPRRAVQAAGLRLLRIVGHRDH